MTTFTLILGILACVLIAVLVTDRLAQHQARRDRQIMRRLHEYLAALPPARPW